MCTQELNEASTRRKLSKPDLAGQNIDELALAYEVIEFRKRHLKASII